MKEAQLKKVWCCDVVEEMLLLHICITYQYRCKDNIEFTSCFRSKERSKSSLEWSGDPDDFERYLWPNQAHISIAKKDK